MKKNLAMINIHNINYKIKDRVIFNNANLHLKNNCINFIIGENGVGKTTLINELIKYFMVNKIYLNNTLIKNNAIFYQSSERTFLPRIKGGEYLEFRDKLLLTDNHKNYTFYEKLFNLNLKNYINEYSTGMKRKIEFIPSLFKKYSVYIFDEPFNGLD
ncbi:MAG: ATP-binding cassette domain-containing protein, partial [Flavobacteriales bacterium]